MREYAGLKFREGDEEEVVEGRFAEYCRATCQRSAAGARYGLVDWLQWMDLEIENVRSVLRRCVIQADFPRGIDLAASLGWYWITRATTEGVRWLDELLAPGNSNPETHARACFIRGFLAVLQADPTAARPALQRAIRSARAAAQVSLAAASLSIASIAAHITGN